MRYCKAVGLILMPIYKLTPTFFQVIKDYGSNSIFNLIILGKIAKFPILKAFCESFKSFYLG